MYPATETKRIASGIQKLKRKKRKKISWFFPGIGKVLSEFLRAVKC